MSNIIKNKFRTYMYMYEIQDLESCKKEPFLLITCLK